MKYDVVILILIALSVVLSIVAQVIVIFRGTL